MISDYLSVPKQISPHTIMLWHMVPQTVGNLNTRGQFIMNTTIHLENYEQEWYEFLHANRLNCTNCIGSAGRNSGIRRRNKKIDTSLFLHNPILTNKVCSMMRREYTCLKYTFPTFCQK